MTAACYALGVELADLLFFEPCNEAAALAVCAACPLIDTCRDLALQTEGGTSVYGRFGVIGGMTPLDRALSAGVLRHGTVAAWRAGCLCSTCEAAKPEGARRQRQPFTAAADPAEEVAS